MLETVDELVPNDDEEANEEAVDDADRVAVVVGDRDDWTDIAVAVTEPKTVTDELAAEERVGTDVAVAEAVRVPVDVGEGAGATRAQRSAQRRIRIFIARVFACARTAATLYMYFYIYIDADVR